MAGPPSPTVAVDSDRTLLRRWRERDDLVARDMLLARYLPRARRVAAQYAYRQEPLDDLHQVASIGLMKALDRYDPDQGAALWTYALPTIVGELKRHFRDNCWTIRVPRPVQERAMTVQRAIRELTAQLGRSPTPREIAERTGLRREELLEAMEAGSAHDPRSLYATSRPGPSAT
jgi:RNA polymerase sigma-B factor